MTDDELLRLFLTTVYADAGRRKIVGLRKVWHLGKEAGRAEAKREYDRLLSERGIAA